MSSDDDTSSYSTAESEEEEIEDLSNDVVVTKYRMAADIATNALQAVVAAAVPGKAVVELCELGDSVIQKATDGLFSKAKGEKKVEKGIAFPTCISVNNIVGHYSPLKSDTPLAVLQDGDLVKIDLGVQVDGYIAMGAHTFVCGQSEITGRAADVVAAAHYAAECVHRLLRPGKKGSQITDAILKCAEAFKVTPVEGTLSHQMKRFVIDGNKVIINKPSLEHKVDDFEVEENEVYGIDIVMSTGEGKTSERDLRTTVFKRRVDQQYRLKMKASLKTFSEFNRRFPSVPFTLRALEDEKTAKLGIIECVKHDLVAPMPVLFEKDGELVAQIKFTALVMPKTTHRVAGIPTAAFTTANQITDEGIVALLKTETKKPRKKRSAKKAQAAATPAQ